MAAILVFGIALTVVVLISGLAARSVLSTALMFLAVGALVGDAGFGWVPSGQHNELVTVVADVALFSSLLVDGMHAGRADLSGNWRGPFQALVLGIPLTMGGIAVLAHFIGHLAWSHALLVGAVLSPTDPVFAAAIIGRSDIPARLRNLLNVESGLNDGLALPLVFILLATAAKSHVDLVTIVRDLADGIVIGIAIPLAFAGLLRLPLLGAEPRLQPLGPLAVGITLYGVCALTHANPYLAAFSAGATLVLTAPKTSRAFEPFGELLAELGKFAALLVFGTLLTPDLFSGLSIGGYIVAALALLAVRPVVMVLCLWGARLNRLERFAVAWFGPKGFASAVYGLIVLESGVSGGQEAFALIAVCIAMSIALHSSSDVPIARLFDVPGAAMLPSERAGKPIGESLTLTEDQPPLPEPPA